MTKSRHDGPLPRPKLMIPGPVGVDDDVLAEMGSPVTAHYGSDWVKFYGECTEMARRTFVTEGDVFFLVSSGSGAVEAGIASLFGPGDKVIIVENGFFGRRAIELAQSHGLHIISVRAPWGLPVDPEAVRVALRQEPGVAGIVAVHHETSTGVLNPVQQLGQVAAEFGVAYVVDAVASLGAETLRMDEWGIDICVTAANKCLGALPGIAPVAVSRQAWEIIDARQSRHGGGWYLNLKTWRTYREKWGEHHPTPVTISSNAMMALYKALGSLHAEGLDSRIARVRKMANKARVGMRERGFTLFVDRAHASSVISTFNRLEGMDVPAFIRFLEDVHQIRISGGIGELNGRVFRVGHIGKATTPEYVDAFLEAVADYCRKPLKAAPLP